MSSLLLLWSLGAIDFQKDVKPILANHCFHCHGPDAQNRKAGLRLDTRAGAVEKVVVPGDAAKSLLWQRVAHPKPALRMPPPSAHKELSPAQAETLRAWIQAGAPWKEHWSLVAPVRPAVPAGASHPIDAFVQARLAQEKLSPAPEADRPRLIRRLSLDLTGLPPSPEEVDAFVRDGKPGAYERVVERYLASPHWGEHRARYWLDAARYGDTHGLHSDNRREIWPWRDWVIQAFHRNMPYDQFVVEQLAGDLLPHPTLDQRIATGFHRNHIATGEGGVIPEEVKAIYVKDMVDTTATVFLGLTLGCATCHDHKYDPLSQKDFYRMAAFFNHTTEVTVHGEIAEPEPVLVIPRPEDAARLAELEPEVVRLRQQWQDRVKSMAKRAPLASPQRAALQAQAVAALPPGPFTAQVQCGYLDQHLITLAAGHHEGLRWELAIESFLPVFRLEGRGIAGQLALRGNTFRLPPVSPKETEITVTWDGSNRAEGVTIHANGQALAPSRVAARPLRGEPDRKFIKQTLFYPRVLGPLEVVQSLFTPSAFSLAVEQAPALFLALEEAAREYRNIRMRGHVTLVMREKEGEAKAHLLERGQYDRPGEELGAGTPAVLPPMRADWPRNRLGLARWLVDAANPLTARVAVNRFWQELFGTGLVKTSDDFGSTGEPPVHPELLDWLAVEFRESGWDVKKLFRLMVTSGTYRQAAVLTEDKRQRDPENRLLSRGPRFRMDAEMLRDSALAASGLLERAVGGESVKPRQPEGVWESVAVLYSNTRFYRPDSGPALRRRSLYTFWKRAAPPPALEILNAPTRETCVVRRERTNTPLQALVTLNDPDFFAAARALAQEAKERSRRPLDYAAERLLARRLTPEESAAAERTLVRLRAHYRTHQDEARTLTGRPDPEAAAWVMLVSQLMNLDEALNK